MSSNIFKTKLFKVIVIVIISSFLVFLNPYNAFNPIRSVFFVIFSPFQKVSYKLTFEISEVKNFLSSIGQLKKENENLIKENRELLAEKTKLEDAGRENEILRQELKLLPREKFNLEGAGIVSQDFYGQGDWIEIDKGSKDGIEKEMPVIVDSGILVGKIGETYFNTSKVILLSNPDSTVNVIDSKTNSKGVLRGEYGLGVIMDMVLQSESLNQGDDVITSGIGKGFPRGLLVGKIQEIGSSEDRLFRRAIISSPVDFSRLQFVFVIKN
jgi:rod shape-determining protein MreC